MSAPEPRRPSAAAPSARRASTLKPPPSPLLDFTIPSLHDGLALDCRIYSPGGALGDPEAAGGLGTGREGLVRGAIVAHPYATTGGSYDDHVVVAVVETLLAQGWVCATFNFRGVKGGRGSVSWTSKPEVADYKSVVGLLVAYLAGLGRERSVAQGGEMEIELILGGYSYGSLIMSQLGDVDAVLAPFREAVLEGSAGEILRTAEELVVETRKTEGDEGADAGKTQSPVNVSSIGAALPLVKARYLLVSPLLGPVAGMLGLSLPSVPKGIKNLFRKAPEGPVEDDSNSMESPLFVNNPTLAIFGAEEGFTSAKKLTTWAEKLQAASPVRPSAPTGGRQGSVVPRLFDWDMVEDAGHFWREPSVMGILKGKIKTWTNTL